MPFVKLDCGMLNSSIWPDRSAREVFITALLMAEPCEITEPTEQLEIRSLNPTGWVVPPDWYGFVAAAGIGIIHRALVDQEAGLAALERLCLPEPESRSKRFEGRRLARVDGGFIVLNYFEYRDRDYTSAERSRRYRQRVASRRDDIPPSRETVTTPRDITQVEVEVDTEVRTVGPVPVRTVGNTVVSREQNSHDDNDSERRSRERRQGDGANAPGSLPRDHIKHRICGGPLSKLCLTYNQFDLLAARYRGATTGETEIALKDFLEYVITKIPDDKLAGDWVWILRHFDAWLVHIGRVAPAPSKKKPKQEIDLVALEKEINEDLAAKADRARARR